MDPNILANSIIDIYRKHGQTSYGEQCSILSHSMQAGEIAKAKGYDNELILAAFLHDIGHLYPLEIKDKEFDQMGEFGIEAHDHWGAECLSQFGLSDRITTTVKNHVAAKRYLCATDPEYYNKLSIASKNTLEYQGGPMKPEEVTAFESDPFFKDSLLIRKLDDEAKGVDFEITEEHFNFFIALLAQHFKGIKN